MVRLLFLIVIVIPINQLKGQQADTIKANHTLEVKLSTLISGKESLPYWWIHQNSSRFSKSGSSQFFSQIQYSGNLDVWKGVDFFWDTELAANINYNVKASLIQSNIGLRSHLFILKVGIDEEFFGEHDHKLSFGNLVNNTNALPLPKITLSTNGWVPSPVLGKTLYYKGYIAHGWFEKERYQSGAFLHQKHFYLQSRILQERLKVSIGLIHNAQWGGQNLNSEIVQPTGLRNYARVFLGGAGDSDALTTDQLNVLGNHLGTYDLSASFDFNGFIVKNYWQFLWEDRSGLVPLNWRDGLLGVELHVTEKSIIKNVVFEIVRTNSQDADGSYLDGVKQVVPDDFLNNGVYRSGWTYQQTIIGSPLFLKYQLPSGEQSRIQNMINAWNFGLSGDHKKYSYELRIRNFQNQGRRLEKLSEPLRLFSTDVILKYKLKENFQLGYMLNYQEGNFVNGKNIGLGINLDYRIF